VLTKADCTSGADAASDALRARLAATIPILAVNALAPDTAVLLAPHVAAGQTAVLLGSSGAGKSTLANTLLGLQVQDTGPVRAADSRGRHTTTARSLHRLAGGGCLIDTPGLRTLRADADAEAFAAVFADIETLAAQCRFRDCTHSLEPGCAVREGIAADRLANWHKLRRDLRRDTLTPLDRRQLFAQGKARMRAGRERIKMKREG
jgi:ribosome biogenesis GTPase / thiamine phosphate phosphatase